MLRRLMNVHTHRWQRGFWLAVLTAVTWGSLPLAMALLVQQIPPLTITWWRFSGSAVALGLWLAFSGGLPRFDANLRSALPLLGMALVGLTGNYLCYATSLLHTTPSVSQIVIQLAPVLLLFSGLWLFGERFSPGQWVGFAVLAAGLLLFFNRRLPELLDLHAELGLGVGLVVMSSVLWAGYAIAQKRLQAWLSAQQVLMLLFGAGSLVLLPFSHPASALQLDGLGWAMLSYAALNTVVGYGAFAEAMVSWEVARVSAVVATAPVVTLAGMALLERFAPGVLPPEHLNALSVFGALAVVGGSVLCALWGRRAAAAVPAPMAPPAVTRD
jgi:drug/metabolite transporter (DMT)-like permease